MRCGVCAVCVLCVCVCVLRTVVFSVLASGTPQLTHDTMSDAAPALVWQLVLKIKHGITFTDDGLLSLPLPRYQHTLPTINRILPPITRI